MTDKTGIGDRMKAQYETRAQTHLPRRTYTIIRLDGKAFHTYTKGCTKPFDRNLSNAMQYAAAALCDEAQGACVGYVQSDEISILLTDFSTNTTEAWFDGNVQKIVSVSASLVTAEFNWRRDAGHDALFDSRVFTIPDRTEVGNYFIWRQQDCIRNSILGLGQAHFSHKQLHGLKGTEIQELLWQERGVNWADEDPTFKNGAMVYRRVFEKDGVTRHEWVSGAAPVFTQDRNALMALVPDYV